MGHSIKQFSGMMKKTVVRVSCNHGVPGEEIPLGHGGGGPQEYGCSRRKQGSWS